MQEGFELGPADLGLLGAVVVDTQGDHTPELVLEAGSNTLSDPRPRPWNGGGASRPDGGSASQKLHKVRRALRPGVCSRRTMRARQGHLRAHKQVDSTTLVKQCSPSCVCLGGGLMLGVRAYREPCMRCCRPSPASPNLQTGVPPCWPGHAVAVKIARLPNVAVWIGLCCDGAGVAPFLRCLGTAWCQKPQRPAAACKLHLQATVRLSMDTHKPGARIFTSLSRRAGRVHKQPGGGAGGAAARRRPAAGGASGRGAPGRCPLSMPQDANSASLAQFDMHAIGCRTPVGMRWRLASSCVTLCYPTLPCPEA